jgi:pantoate--beta-alanine ligase
MAADLKLPITIVPVPTVRAADGLALSSRNAYLSPEERAAATALYRALQEAKARYDAGEREAAALARAVSETIAAEPRARLQYAEVRDAKTLAAVERVERPVVVAVAAFIGKARLIDNVVLGLATRPK